MLKPNDDYGGHGVVLGWETGRQQWQEAVRAAEGVMLSGKSGPGENNDSSLFRIESISISCSLTSILSISERSRGSVNSFVGVFTIECYLGWRSDSVVGVGRMTTARGSSRPRNSITSRGPLYARYRQRRLRLLVACGALHRRWGFRIRTYFIKPGRGNLHKLGEMPVDSLT